MSKRKIITICCSSSFYKEALVIGDELKKKGFKVLIPITALEMKRMGNFDVEKHKTWYKNPKDYVKKKKLMQDHFKKIIKGDVILVVNLRKNGVDGYIGGNALMEMALAFHFKKPIYILNNISDNSPFKEEIFAFNPIFINGDLNKLKG